ncbi:FMN-binding negative transcriptional regulator [Nonomuraea rhodomycinica]|uniref:FMN-binding negative transcriptional regulator n=1 Tax=Nonomuraea rhodomycinica TaxID=1712872 RepID=A0A7Y6ING4_9ACTN|nr:FMN-binding negative transcriptional regulator [Nonomuraea rhodomycinica]NUW41412.1 FMN-binding negative transcriptional regulator [Nonomuraea rhodomycinica]
MHVFPRYAPADPAHAARLVRENPFALVVSVAGGVPVATHAPVLVEEAGGPGFEGATLVGHLARVNPQWRAWESAPEALVVFSGPHGYVSPTSYEADPAVPTWNYAAVHLTGRIEVHPDPLEVVERTVEAMESSRTPSWRPGAASREVFARIVSGVVAFRVRVTGERGMFKLSQDIDDGRRARVRRDADPALAALMDQVDPRPADAGQQAGPAGAGRQAGPEVAS